MDKVQRKLGKLLHRSADSSQVAVLLKDFDDADQMLARLIDAGKAWRDSWIDILNAQQHLVNNFHVIYSPIVGAGDQYIGHEPISTPQSTLERVIKLDEQYGELKADLLDEVNQVDTRIVQPAMRAKEYMQPMKKILKKREDRKLDFERYQGRVDSGRKKTKRSERDNLSLAKSESDLARAQEEYTMADDHLKSTLPPIINAAFSLLPTLLAAQIMTQNALLSHYYTLLHNYCQEENFPSPPPSMTEVVALWEAALKPAKQDIESLACIASGKVVRQPMNGENRSPGLSTRNGNIVRRASYQPMIKAPVSPTLSARSEPSEPPSPDPIARRRISSVPSQSSLALSTPNYNNPLGSPSPGDFHTPQGFAPAGPRADYFGRDRLPSSSSVASIAAIKKKPPPPPPPVKRQPSSQDVWVTALYDFAGQGQGDLIFHEGDRIRVVKKTNSKDDWWEGVLKGVQGSFPANYCQAV